MPAILQRVVDANHLHHAVRLAGRDTWRGRNRTALTPKAIGFLVPLFVVFIFGPFLCIWLTRNRRSRRRPLPPSPRTVIERREDARGKLDTVTEVSNVAGEAKYAYRIGVEEDKESTDSVSVPDRDCAICLSTLHAPSPPEPAKLAEEGVEAVKPPSVSGMSILEKEDILRLKVCCHEFHAECLTSWFVLRKHSCPICRAEYYGKDVERKLSEEHELREIERVEQLPEQRPDGNGPR